MGIRHLFSDYNQQFGGAPLYADPVDDADAADAYTAIMDAITGLRPSEVDYDEDGGQYSMYAYPSPLADGEEKWLVMYESRLDDDHEIYEADTRYDAIAIMLDLKSHIEESESETIPEPPDMDDVDDVGM